MNPATNLAEPEHREILTRLNPKPTQLSGANSAANPPERVANDIGNRFSRHAGAHPVDSEAWQKDATKGKAKV